MKLHLSEADIRAILCSHAKAISHQHAYNTMNEADDGDGVVLSFTPPQPGDTIMVRRWWQLKSRPVVVPEPINNSVEAQAIREALADQLAEERARSPDATFSEVAGGADKFKARPRRAA